MNISSLIGGLSWQYLKMVNGTKTESSRGILTLDDAGFADDLKLKLVKSLPDKIPFSQHRQVIATCNWGVSHPLAAILFERGFREIRI